jgi:hypothetical protein
MQLGPILVIWPVLFGCRSAPVDFMASSGRVVPELRHEASALRRQSTSQAEPASGSAADIANDSIDDIAVKLVNPITSLWNVTSKINVRQVSGEALDGRDWTTTWDFQPSIPLGLPGGYVWIHRPVIPFIFSRDVPDGSGGFDSENSIPGDIQYLTMVGKTHGDMKTSATVRAAGATMIFPTAEVEEAGLVDTFSLGPAFMVMRSENPWVYGALFQHWWDVNGDSDESFNFSSIQLIYSYKLPDGWRFGSGPTVTIDWDADSGDVWTVPLGIGINKTVRWGKLPIRFGLEYQYYLSTPDSAGPVQNVLFRIQPIIPALFQGWS